MAHFSPAIVLGVLLAAPFAGTAGAANPTAKLRTPSGVIELELLFDRAPRAVSHFVELARSGFYGGTLLNRGVAGRLVGAAGEKDGNPPHYCVADEFTAALRHDKPGVVSFATRQRDDNAAAFVIALAPAPQLDDRQTIFAQVTAGLDVATALAAGDLAGTPVKIEAVEIAGDFTPAAFEKIPRLTPVEARERLDAPVRKLAAVLGAQFAVGTLAKLTASDVRSECGAAQILYDVDYSGRKGARLLVHARTTAAGARISQIQFEAE